MRLRKILGKILLWTGISLVVIIVSAVILAFVFEKDIKGFMVNEINKSLNAKIAYNEFSLSFIRDFPFATIRLTEVNATTTLDKQRKDTLLKADKVYLKFSLIDFFRKNYTLKKIEISNASLSLKVFKDGKDNFHFMKENKGPKSSVFFEIEKLSLENTRVRFTNAMSAQDYEFECESISARWKLTDKEQNLKLKGNVLVKHFRSGGISYIDNRKVKVNADILVKNASSLFVIKRAELKMNDLVFRIEGSVQSKKGISNISLNLVGEKNKLEEFLQLLPEQYKNIRDAYESEGELAFQVKIFGEYGLDKIPMITAEAAFSNGKIIRKENHIELSEVNIKAIYRNNHSFLPDSGFVEIGSFKSKILNGYINGSLRLKNFIRPDILLNVNIDADLAGFAGFTGYDTLENIKGRLKTNLKFKGKLESNNKFTTRDFLNGFLEGKSEISGLGFQVKNNNLMFKDFSGDFVFNNNDLSFNNFIGKISGSDFKLKGSIKNIFPFLFIPGNDVKIAADLYAEKLDLDEILTGSNGNKKGAYEVNFSDKVSFVLTANIKNLKFRNFRANEIKGDVLYLNKSLSSSNLVFKAMEGSINASISIDGSRPDKISTSCSAIISDVNIQKLFYSFENFGQKGITDKHIWGTLFATASFAAVLNKRLEIDPATVEVKTNIRIENGELNDYKPLLGLSKYINVEELKRVKFSTLNNMIEIKNKTLFIPEMEIKSSALNLQGTGTHTFGNVIDYHIRLLMADLRSRKIKKPSDEFGVEQDDGLGKTVLFIHITGTGENPAFKYDAKSAVNKIIGDLKKEKDNLKKLFRKDSLSIQEKKNTDLQEKGKFIIDWDENKKDVPAKDTVNQKKNQKKNNEQKVKIEWD